MLAAEQGLVSEEDPVAGVEERGSAGRVAQALEDEPLEVATRKRIATALEGLLRDATGRPLKSRPFLDEVLS